MKCAIYNYAAALDAAKAKKPGNLSLRATQDESAMLAEVVALGSGAVVVQVRADGGVMLTIRQAKALAGWLANVLDDGP